MKRLLVIPAAGMGTRLSSPLPKVLHPVCGRPMIDWLLHLYAPCVDRALLVLHPSFAALVADHCATAGLPVAHVLQREPTGMLAAILEARVEVERLQPSEVWVTWCDQIAVRPATVARLASTLATEAPPAMALPTVVRPEPYIHFDRDARGQITAVRQRREGDPMPAVGESDSGLFGMTGETFLKHLVEFPAETGRGAATRELNFLPFIPWLAGRASVATFPIEDDMEAIGVNTPEDVLLLEGYLRRHA